MKPVGLHVHFLCPLCQLGSGILTESCFLRAGAGNACEHIGCNSVSLLRPRLFTYHIIRWSWTQTRLTTAQQSSR